MTPGHPGPSLGPCSTAIDRQPTGPITKSCEAPHGASDLCHYIIVRADLPPGSQVAQAVHAAGESTPTRVPPNTVAVVLTVPDQAGLLALDAALTGASVEHVLIVECDGEPMAIGCAPTRDRATLRRLTSSLPLAGRTPKEDPRKA